MPLKVSMVAIGTTLSGHYQSSDFGKYASSYKGDFMTIDIWPTAEITLGKKTSSMSLPISSHAAVFAKNTTILSMNR